MRVEGFNPMAHDMPIVGSPPSCAFLPNYLSAIQLLPGSPMINGADIFPPPSLSFTPPSERHINEITDYDKDFAEGDLDLYVYNEPVKIRTSYGTPAGVASSG
jgi:hypothetical protein